MNRPILTFSRQMLMTLKTCNPLHFKATNEEIFPCTGRICQWRIQDLKRERGHTTADRVTFFVSVFAFSFW